MASTRTVRLGVWLKESARVFSYSTVGCEFQKRCWRRLARRRLLSRYVNPSRWLETSKAHVGIPSVEPPIEPLREVLYLHMPKVILEIDHGIKHDICSSHSIVWEYGTLGTLVCCGCRC